MLLDGILPLLYDNIAILVQLMGFPELNVFDDRNCRSYQNLTYVALLILFKIMQNTLF